MSEDQSDGPVSHRHARVSILVFVELALDERLFFVLFPV